MEKLRGAWAAVAGAILVSLLHFGMGANNLGLSLIAAAAEAALLLAIVWRGWVAAELQARAGVVACFALLFSLLIAAVALPLVTGAWASWLHERVPAVHAAVDRQAASVELLKLLALGCLFVCGLLVGSSLRRYRILVTWLVCLAAALALFGHVVNALWPDRMLGLQRITAHGRLTATFVSANTAGTLFGCMALLVAGFLVRRGRDGWRSNRSVLDEKPIQLAFLLLFALSLLMTASRMGVAATLLSSVAILAFRGAGRRGRGWGWGYASLMAGGALVVLVGLFYGGGLARRLPDLSSDFGYRLRLMETHYAFFLERPWFGWGMGSFRVLNNQAITADNFSLLYDVGAAHNVYIQWLSQAGLVGAGLIWAICLLAFALISIGATRQGEAGDHLAAVAAAILVFALHGVSDYALEVPSMSALLTLLLGAGVGLATRRPDQEASSKPSAPVGSTRAGLAG